jgi:hypothetical protein
VSYCKGILRFLDIFSSKSRITAAEMKYMRITAGYTWRDYKTNGQITKEWKITPILDKLLEYKRSWLQHVNRMPRNRLPRVVKHYRPTGRRNLGRPLKRRLDTGERLGSTSGPTPWRIYDDEFQISNFVYIRPLEAALIRTDKPVGVYRKMCHVWAMSAGRTSPIMCCFLVVRFRRATFNSVTNMLVENGSI